MRKNSNNNFNTTQASKYNLNFAPTDKYSDESFVQSFIHRQYGIYVSKSDRSVRKGNNKFKPYPNITGGAEPFYNILINTVKPFILPSWKTLDIGTATGRIAAEFAQLMPNGVSIGLDFSECMVSYAEKIVKSPKGNKIYFQAPVTRTVSEEYYIEPFGINNAYFLTGDAQNLPFDSNVFDLISCVNVLHRVKNPQKVIKEITRTTKSSGLLLMCNSYDWEPRYTQQDKWFDNFSTQISTSDWQLISEIDGVPWQTSTYDRKYTTAYNHIQLFQKTTFKEKLIKQAFKNLNIL